MVDEMVVEAKLADHERRILTLEAKGTSGNGRFAIAIAAASSVLVGLEVVQQAGIIEPGIYQVILLAVMTAIGAFVGRKQLAAAVTKEK